MSSSIYGQVSQNQIKTVFIMVFFTCFAGMVAFLLGKTFGFGTSWVAIAILVAGITSLGSYYYSDKLVLAISGARPADRKRDFDLFTVTENIALASGIPKPRVYIIEDSAPNAFATGRDPKHAVVCATTGLLRKLERRELEGVIAHEMSHIKNYDIRLMAIVSILVGMIALLSDWFTRSLWWRKNDDRNTISAPMIIFSLLLLFLSPIIATLIQLAVSRRREFLADASGALLTRNPDALASALEKISKDKEVLEAATNATAHLYITNPFKEKKFGAFYANLFNTHPPIEERIKILRNM